jgi:glycosyltransferase involved in cell wall biosynthesis
MLKVVVDATAIQQKPSGVGLYVANLINSLHQLQDQENFQLGISFQPGFKSWLSGNLAVPELINQYENIHILPLPVKLSNLFVSLSPNPLISNYFEHCFGYPDIIQGTNYSVYCCQNSKSILNIYDLSFIKYPDYTDSVVKKYEKRLKHCLKWTDLVITISESSKQDIVKYLAVDPQKIYVTPLASRYYPEYLANQPIDKIVNSTDYNFNNPYLLFVSTIEPRKNIINLIAAFNYLKQHHKIEQHLVLIGKKGWHYEPIFAAIEASPYKNQIHHLNYLSDELVALFYAQADAFVYPSYYEGFGLPVLEAMTLGTPVVTSNTSSLPEVAGDAALFVNPDDFRQLADAILQVISNSNLRNQLIQKGKAQAKLFSWQRTAKDTIKAYKSLLT